VRQKTVIVSTRPDREWRLGRFGARRGTPMQEYGPSYADYGAASWACFRARWLEATGQECPVN
jgi:hypothetical protein